MGLVLQNVNNGLAAGTWIAMQTSFWRIWWVLWLFEKMDKCCRVVEVKNHDVLPQFKLLFLWLFAYCQKYENGGSSDGMHCWKSSCDLLSSIFDLEDKVSYWSS